MEFTELKNNRWFITQEGVYKNRLWRLLKWTIRHWYHFVYTGNKQERTHRLVAEAFMWEIKEWFEVNHKDWNKLNNNIENLEIVTHAENVRHASNTWLNKPHFWMKNWNSILTEEQVNEIKKYHKPRHPEYSWYALSKKYWVSTSAISYIVNWWWKHLTN